jgi:GAF domain-containing protein
MTTDQRWPRLAGLLGSSPLRAVLAVPVHAGGGPVGTLNGYAEQAHEWDRQQTEALTSLAAALDRLLTSNLARHRSDQLAVQLQQALDYRGGDRPGRGVPDGP